MFNNRLNPENCTELQWVSQMDVDIQPQAVRKTSIIGTIGKMQMSLREKPFFYIFIITLGPNTNSVDMITQLRNAGLNVVRMNFSHGSYEVKKKRKKKEDFSLSYLH
jgi:pyruvate kinase